MPDGEGMWQHQENRDNHRGGETNFSWSLPWRHKHGFVFPTCKQGEENLPWLHCPYVLPTQSSKSLSTLAVSKASLSILPWTHSTKAFLNTTPQRVSSKAWKLLSFQTYDHQFSIFISPELPAALSTADSFHLCCPPFTGSQGCPLRGFLLPHCLLFHLSWVLPRLPTSPCGGGPGLLPRGSSFLAVLTSWMISITHWAFNFLYLLKTGTFKPFFIQPRLLAWSSDPCISFPLNFSSFFS